MTRNVHLLVVSGLLILTGCGGGGGDGRDATNVSGTWRGALTKVSDNCSPSAPSTINITHRVSQNEDAVSLTAESGVQFLGNTVGENGFSVNGSHAVVGNASCTDQTEISYDSINNDTDTTADVDIRINRSCPGNAACTIEFTGTASRTVSAATNTPAPGTPTPVVTPSATTTPGATTGGCNDIITRPANGTYSGDGGCGISDAAFSIQNNNVVLNPFGANGATTFAISSSNSSSASSNNNNLTIQGTAGYSCTMVCSPPSTFTVQCVREGGTTCVEKF